MFILFRINGELYCDFKFSSFACTKRRLPQTDAEEKSLALSMKRALQPAVCRHEFPNFQVTIFSIICFPLLELYTYTTIG